MVTNPRQDRPVSDLTTRARIRDAAMAEFADKGYRGASMRGIASAAGVSLGLIQHHFGTKDGLRAACDEFVLQLVAFKTAAVEDGTIGDQETLNALMAVAPAVQRYAGRALVDGSPRIAELFDQLVASGESYLTSSFPDRFTAGSPRTRDAAAVLIAMNTSTMILQAQLARQMDVEPFSEAALRRIGGASFDVYEAIAEMVASEMWRKLRQGVDSHPDAAAGRADGDAAGGRGDG